MDPVLFLAAAALSTAVLSTGSAQATVGQAPKAAMPLCDLCLSKRPAVRCSGPEQIMYGTVGLSAKERYVVSHSLAQLHCREVVRA